MTIQPMASNDPHPMTWQAWVWRLLLTIFLLLTLAGPGLKVFNTVTNLPNTHVLPASTESHKLTTTAPLN